jgi:uncharacterized surface protein with fasciclin (FAS1) repeats
VFVPSPQALEALPDEIFTDPELARQFLEGHVVNESLSLADLQARGQVTALGGQTLTIVNDTISSDGGPIQITTPDQQATNGFVQGIDGVLFVPEVTPPAQTSTPAAAPTNS